LIKTGMPTC